MENSNDYYEVHENEYITDAEREAVELESVELSEEAQSLISNMTSEFTMGRYGYAYEALENLEKYIKKLEVKTMK